MVEALGVDTSKTFSLIETGEALERSDEPSPTRAAVLVRLSHSHIRIGTFQRLLFLDETDNLRRLLDYTIRTYCPDAWREAEAERAGAFLEEVCRRVARTGARWMLAGFVHGVLNTDNINVTGESFDYGPWRFLPRYDPAFTAAYFDETGLYAYGRQPNVLLWNLYRLAECLLPLAAQSDLEKSLGAFEPALQREFTAALVERLGLRSEGYERDGALAKAVWTFLSDAQAPFERFFFDWYGGVAGMERAARSPSGGLYGRDSFKDVLAALERFAPADAARLSHPYFLREAPCTMLIDEVEALWAPIADADDWAPLAAKLADIRSMAEAIRPAASDADPMRAGATPASAAEPR
jgi:uncharacterized protein YdiU (UPF0061 family)